jgi:hypothetical protein
MMPETTAPVAARSEDFSAPDRRIVPVAGWKSFATGQVVGGRQLDTGWFQSSAALLGLRTESRDTIFLAEETNRTSLLQVTKDWAQIVFQLGLGLTGIAAAVK